VTTLSVAHEVADSSALPCEVRAGVYVVIAAYNESACIRDVVRDVMTEYPNVIVVDDGSSDDTAEIAIGKATWVLRHAANCGQGAALQTGIEFALKRGAEYVVTFDADGQHRVNDIAALIKPIWTGLCDISLGSRFLGSAVDLPNSRRLLLRAAILFTRIVNGLKLTDTHNGLRAFSRRAAERIDITADRMAHASELFDIIRDTGLEYCEVPVEIRYTEHSLAKGQSSGEAFRIAWHYFVGRIFR
jgi:glycosyltransferase involved in cell wall biosynthesis